MEIAENKKNSFGKAEIPGFFVFIGKYFFPELAQIAFEIPQIPHFPHAL